MGRLKANAELWERLWKAKRMIRQFAKKKAGRMSPPSYLLGANLRVLSTSYVLPEIYKNITDAVSY